MVRNENEDGGGGEGEEVTSRDEVMLGNRVRVATNNAERQLT